MQHKPRHSGHPAATETMTVADYCTAYLRHPHRDRRPCATRAARRRYESRVRHLLCTANTPGALRELTAPGHRAAGGQDA
jgi:hypothetical protein